MEVTFVRHGQSEANAGLSESPDSALTEIGQRQSEAVGNRLKDGGFGPNGSCWTLVSPLIRTLMTSEPIQEITQVPTELFPDACEFFSEAHAERYRRFVGLPLAQIQARFPFIKVSDHFPCAEPWWPLSPETDSTLYTRAIRARDALLARFGMKDRIVIVSHADPIGRLIEAFLRLMPGLQCPPWPDNASFSRIRLIAPNRPAELLLINDTSHLDSLGISTPD